MIEKELEIINKYLYEDETYIDIGYDDFEMFKSAIECLIFYLKKQEKKIKELKQEIKDITSIPEGDEEIL